MVDDARHLFGAYTEIYPEVARRAVRIADFITPKGMFKVYSTWNIFL